MQLDNPYGVDPELDRLVVPSQRPKGWSENLVGSAYDPDTKIGFYAHFSRVADDPNIWEGVLCVFLPNGELLVSRSFDTQDTDDRANAGALRYTCCEALHKWHLVFNGMVRRVTSSQLASGLLQDGPIEHLKLDLDVNSITPVWSSGTVEDQDWGDLHIEQPCTFDGNLNIDGKDLAFHSKGFRDHSRGPRDHSSLSREGWSFGFVPSGKIYFCVRIWQDSGVGFETGMYYDGATMHDVTSVEVPPVLSTLGEPRNFGVSVGGDFGKFDVKAQLQSSAPFTLLHPIGQAFGVDTNDTDSTMLLEGPIEIDWDGERGFGWMERLARVKDLSVDK